MSTDLAWAAGFFDGEGHIGIQRRKVSRSEGFAYNYFLVVSVANTYRPSIVRFMSTTGFSDCGIHTKIDEGRRPLWSFGTSHGKALSVIETLYPYLCNKKDQADLAFQFASLIDKKTGRSRSSQSVQFQREICRKRMSALKVLV